MKLVDKGAGVTANALKCGAAGQRIFCDVFGHHPKRKVQNLDPG